MKPRSSWFFLGGVKVNSCSVHNRDIRSIGGFLGLLVWLFVLAGCGEAPPQSSSLNSVDQSDSLLSSGTSRKEYSPRSSVSSGSLLRQACERALKELDLSKEDPARLEALLDAVRKWTEHEPIESANWASLLSKNANSNQVMQAVINSWIDSDPEGASRWLYGLPSGEAHEMALAAYITVWLPIDPAGALDLAVQSNNNGGYDSLIEQEMKGWLKREPKVARAWLSKSSLTDESKYQLLYPSDYPPR